MRSKIVHGRWKDDPKIEAVMADTEAIARTALRHIIENPNMLTIFMGKDRDGFLEDLVLSHPLNSPRLTQIPVPKLCLQSAF